MSIENEMLIWIRKNNPVSACVEAAHIYMDETPGEQHLQSATIGKRIADELSKKNLLVSKALFIDDYNPDSNSWVLDVDKYVDCLMLAGFSPDIITMESSLEIPAMILFSKLKIENNLVHEENGIYLEKKKACLTMDGRPVCNLLDAALYVAKMSMFDLVVTVLPRSFRGQQKKTRKILRSMGYFKLPIFNIYY